MTSIQSVQKDLQLVDSEPDVCDVNEHKGKERTQKTAAISRRLLDCERSLTETDSCMDHFKATIECWSAGQCGIEDLQRKTTALEKTLSTIIEHSKSRIHYDGTHNNQPSSACSGDQSISTKQNVSVENDMPTHRETEHNAVYYSQPIHLSYHIYLEALQQKINEVNELKQALNEVAVLSTSGSVITLVQYVVSSLSRSKTSYHSFIMIKLPSLISTSTLSPPSTQ